MSDSSVELREHTREPVRKAIRRLRWFIGSFHAQVRQTSKETGVTFDVDDQILAAAFLDWLRAFEAQKPADPGDRMRYVGFAAGLMLRTLIRLKPVTVAGRPGDADDTNPAYFWPEGYLYVAYCLNIRSAVLEEDFDEHQTTVPEMREIRTWWTFRENVSEDPTLAIAFLDLFAGEDPHWSEPDLFRTGEAPRIAARFFQPKLTGGT